MEENQDTPESDFSIECFQNYTAPEVFIQGLAGIIDQQDVEAMIRAQKQMLQRFEKTNEMLTNCNALSASRLKTVGPEFKKHIHLLLEMKRDLDYVFKKIRSIKSKLSSQYPEEFTEATRSSFADECEESITDSPNKNKDNRRSLHIKTETIESTDQNRRASK
ncbi:hypothetical protein ABEB36_007359 [Hypothenemus hampei]|uniref:KxDL domain-containing protein n=1 Tax=Hypothenemus hampei TaxID=57062 RepID=A0ABD1ETP5_HYPHA